MAKLVCMLTDSLTGMLTAKSITIREGVATIPYYVEYLLCEMPFCVAWIEANAVYYLELNVKLQEKTNKQATNHQQKIQG